MAAIADELAHMGVAVGEGQTSASWTHAADDSEDSVLTVKVRVPPHSSGPTAVSFPVCLVFLGSWLMLGLERGKLLLVGHMLLMMLKTTSLLSR